MLTEMYLSMISRLIEQIGYYVCRCGVLMIDQQSNADTWHITMGIALDIMAIYDYYS